MTTYREQMELAAKAAGLIGYRYVPECEAMMRDRPGSSLGYWPGPWNPRADSGDALRLAVRAGIWVHPGEHDEYVEAVGVSTVYVPPGNDREAATRLAIFRAAVEIGRSMP